MRKICRYLFLSALLPLCACSDDFRSDYSGVEGELPITFRATYPTETRASDGGFEDGDRMGLYVLDYVDGAPEDIADDPHASNVRFEFDETDNTCKGTVDLYWTSSDTPADLVAYYPFHSAVENAKSVPVSVSRRQDEAGTEDEMGGYESSDFLYAKQTKVMPTSNAVQLTFNHALAGIRVSLIEGDGFGADEWSALDKSVSVVNTVTSGTIDLSDGTVTAETTKETIIPLKYGEDFRAVTLPQTIAGGSQLLAISVGTVGYGFSRDSEMELYPGKLHSFTITVNKKENGSLEFTLTTEGITDWIDSVEFRDGLMRQYVVVSVEEAGGLEEAVTALGLTPSKIYNLKLKGNLNHDDFTYIQENVTSLKALNIYETRTEAFVDHGGGVAGIEKDLLPPEGLRGMSTLTHFVFPKYVREIGSQFLKGSGIMGDLIIPEGVEIIGLGAFMDCKSLGTVSFPTTLKEIGESAFQYSTLRGELQFPEGLTAIGGSAFDGCNITGELIFPEKLEYIGSGAFGNCNFTGSLTIPQGIKEILPYVFSGAGFSGVLTIPEGVEIIGDEAFQRTGFRGELKLPSTLKSVGARSFLQNMFSTVIFPENLGYLGEGAFRGCSRLSGTLELPERLTVIPRDAFSGCTLLDEIVIPKNVTKILGGAFANCYNLSGITSMAVEPPLLKIEYTEDNLGRPYYAFNEVPKDNFTVQVPSESVAAYMADDQWSEFKRISAYSNFVCRPATACALNSSHTETIILNADGPWTAEVPDWISLSVTSGNGKTEINLSISELPDGSDDREGEVVFTLTEQEGITTTCSVMQKNYEYAEDYCLTKQTHTQGSGIDIVFVGDCFDAEAIASGEYLEQVESQIESFFGLEPYSTYKDYFNVKVLFSLSQEVGVNTANVWRNTKFCTYYAPPVGCGSGTLDCHDPDAVFDYVVEHAGINGSDMWKTLVVMTLNSDEYGSNSVIAESGASIAIVGKSIDPYPMDNRGLMQREACGIAFGKLANERATQVLYLTKNEREILSYNHSRGWWQNLSLSGGLSDVSWSDFIFDPDYSDKVDVYEGGLGKTRGCFRSEINSCMNYGIPYFSLAARYDIVKRIMNYAGEEFSEEKFREKDSDKWGEIQTTKAAGDYGTPTVSYSNKTRFYKSYKY